MAEKNKNTTVRRLLIGFSSIILLLIAFGVISIIEIRALSKVSQTIYNHPLVVSNASLNATVSIIKMHRSMKDIVLFDFPSETEKAITAVNKQERLFFENLDAVKKNILGDEGQKLENETRHLFFNWKPIRKEVIKLVTKDQREEAAIITKEKGAEHVAKLENKMLELTSYARDKATDFMHHGEQVHARVIKYTIILISLGLLLSVFIAFFTIKGTQKAEEKIKASLKEKEVLLREVHHRVKNNMQVINSLLKLQFGRIKEKKYADMLKDSQGRIKSMALVHEKLYQTKDFAKIDFNGYIKSLANSLFRSYGVNPKKIALKIEVEDVALGLDSAIPCGLIVNELVSNSLKHAFPNDRDGEIRIAFGSINEDELELEFRDNGIGIPEHIDIRDTDTSGLHLVMLLAEKQLRGKIELDSVRGTKYHIQFKRVKEKVRI